MHDKYHERLFALTIQVGVFVTFTTTEGIICSPTKCTNKKNFIVVLIFASDFRFGKIAKFATDPNAVILSYEGMRFSLGHSLTELFLGDAGLCSVICNW